MEKCEVKGCNRDAEYIHISHEDGDKPICSSCLLYYYPELDTLDEEPHPEDYIRKRPARCFLAIVLGMCLLIPFGLILLLT